MSGTKFRVGEAAKRAAYDRQQEERTRRRAVLVARIRAAYHAEVDREYAEDFYGSMLAELGETP